MLRLRRRCIWRRRRAVSPLGWALRWLWLRARLRLRRGEAQAFVDRQIAFQMRGVTGPGPVGARLDGPPAPFDQVAVVDLAQGRVMFGGGRIRVVAGRARAQDAGPLSRRLAAMVNDIAAQGGGPCIAVDSIDAARAPARSPVFSYNRLRGAENRVLWPLPSHQRPGSPHFVTLHQADWRPFRTKLPRIVWRGTLNGHVAAGPDHPSLKAVIAAQGAAAARDLLRDHPRFRLLDDFIDHPDFDIGLAPDETGAHATDPAVAGWYRPWMPLQAQFRYRYILALEGADVPSNLYPALDSRSVVLRVETAWEAFLDGHLEPWVHYVPVARDLGDLTEKFRWCEAQPEQCEAISRAARRQMMWAKSGILRRQALARVAGGPG